MAERTAVWTGVSNSLFVNKSPRLRATGLNISASILRLGVKHEKCMTKNIHKLDESAAPVQHMTFSC